MAYRDSPFQALKAPLTWAAAVAGVVAGLIALGLALTDHRSATGPYGAVRGEFDEVMEPVTSALYAPVRWAASAADFAGGYFFAVSENRRLKAELDDMRRWRDAAVALKSENERFEALLKLRTEPPVPMVTGRAVSDVRGPFSDARLLDVGAAAGVKVGNPVMSENGVVGRIVGVARSASRVLLLTDVESRTPVLINRNNARAILTGDGGANPRLEFVRGQNAVQDGDVVLTSGDGGLYPRGLPVGVAARDFRGVWRVRLYSDRGAIDFVRVLLFDDFSQAVDTAALAASSLPPLTAAEQADLNAQRAAAEKPPPPPAVEAPLAPKGAGFVSSAPPPRPMVPITAPSARAPDPAPKKAQPSDPTLAPPPPAANALGSPQP